MWSGLFDTEPGRTEFACRLADTPSPEALLDARTPTWVGVDADLVERVTSAVLELDSGVLDDLKHGGVVRKIIPKHDPVSLGLPDRPKLGDYVSVRQSVGALVRPMVLPEPDESALFPYQRQGVEWLATHRAALLADDMGLGKTLQTIAALARLTGRGTVRGALVVCPRSLIATWEDELARWAPHLSRVRVTPTASARAEGWGAVIGRVHVLITNYEQLRDPPLALLKRGVDVLICDEAHRVRNAGAQFSRGVGMVPRSWIWALSGTPMERNILDLATLLTLLDSRRFSLRDASLPTSVLRSRADPYVLRRRKEDVLDELPDLLERRETIELTTEQRDAYHRTLARERRARVPDDFLAILNDLRQVCDYDPDTKRSSKIARITELLLEVKEIGEKAVVFSTFLEPLALLEAALSATQPQVQSVTLTGALTADAREDAIARFRASGGVTALLASTRVAGEGLTLTEANHVFFVNEWWNPSTNLQARDRVLRIGQTKGVTVYRFVCKNTIEESVERILQRKEAEFAVLVGALSEGARIEASSLPSIRRLLRDSG